MKIVKAAEARHEDSTSEVENRVRDMLRDIETRGEKAVRQYSRELDSWDPEEFHIHRDDLEKACEQVKPELRRYLDQAAANIRTFAKAQLGCLQELRIESSPGVILGHSHIPVQSVGAYVPGGKYRLVASALMSGITAKVAGVERVVGITPPDREWGIYPPTAYSMKIAGIDEVLAIGGVQGLATVAFGCVDGVDPVDMIVGAGNQYVAEAKRQLFGRVGIDLVAGPTEILIVADETARPFVVASDLLGQAEHGPTSSAVLVTMSEELGVQVMREVEELLLTLPTADVARQAWDNFGVILVVSDREEAAQIADEFAPEHLEVQTHDDEWFQHRLRNYGALFLGETTNVTFGDKVIGTNHTLPTGRGARYTGGLWVGSFLKTVTYQCVSRDASEQLAIPAGAISRAEGMIGHAQCAELRLRLGEYPRTCDETSVPKAQKV